MPGAFKKLYGEVSLMTYEKTGNNPDNYRFSVEEPGEIQTKLRYINMHMKRAEDFNLQKEILDCMAHKAMAFYKLQDYDQCEQLSLEIITQATELKDDMRIRQATTNLGVLAKMRYEFSTALNYYNQSLDLAKRRNEKWCQARLFNNIANIFECLQDYEKAIEYHQQRLELATELLDLDGISKASSSLGAMYHALGDVEKAIEYYEKVQDVLRKKLKNFDTLADDAAGSDDDFVDFGNDEEDDEDGEEGGGGGGGGGGDWLNESIATNYI